MAMCSGRFSTHKSSLRRNAMSNAKMSPTCLWCNV
ncbi:hypothetical protein MGSAQ_001304 [marine sediment metagenome]|uniref:Uncharacterized protein n=1 Tax=marine sediment metagenome TaxID=412755 RepID=A0A1B6NV50_9ZZZZ